MIRTPYKTLPILIADDDPEDRMLTMEALEESGLDHPCSFVEDGVELLCYLKHQAPYEDQRAHPRPGIILLDLNMPKKDGREALAEIKADPHLRSIPVIILTTSQQEEDIRRSYALGVNSYISKPSDFQKLVHIMDAIHQYWFQVVQLPESRS